MGSHLLARGKFAAKPRPGRGQAVGKSQSGRDGSRHSGGSLNHVHFLERFREFGGQADEERNGRSGETVQDE